MRLHSSIPMVGTFTLAVTTVVGHAAETPPDVVYVTGTVRDFQQSHPDFNVIPVDGFGHCAGNVLTGIGTDYNPVYSVAGYKVATEWTDSTADPIAPHLFMVGGSGGSTIPVTNATGPPSHGEFDTWDSSAGPYNPATAGPAPTFDVGAAMPLLAVPTSMMSLPNLGNLSYTGSNTLTESFHCDSLTLDDNVIIDGQVSILCEGLLYLPTWASIELTAGSTLTLWLQAGASSWNHVDINKVLGDPSLVTFYNLSTVEMMIHNHAEVYARVISPVAPLTITNHGALFGSFAGLQLDFGNHGDYHHDTAIPGGLCGVTMDDVAGTAGVASTGGIAAGFTFDEWYNDILGTNFATAHTIALKRDVNGIYEYLDNAFYPIDGRLFGNEGDDHNRYFTYEFTVDFVFNGCTGQFIEFAGADSAWVFVDGFLGIDLGGVQPAASQHVELDRLGLVDGEVYEVRLFYAHRYGTPAFNLRTNVQILENTSTVVVAAPWD